MKKMILYSNGNTHDINHFMKVYGYAKMIGECEHLAAKEQKQKRKRTQRGTHS
jgi:hypothetical protein